MKDRQAFGKSLKKTDARPQSRGHSLEPEIGACLAHLRALAAKNTCERPCGIGRYSLRAACKLPGLFRHHSKLPLRMRGRYLDQVRDRLGAYRVLGVLEHGIRVGLCG